MNTLYRNNSTWVMIFIVSICLISCSNKKEKTTTSLTADELVHAMVELYSVNAAVNLNHISYQDSTRKVYYQQLAEITGRTVKEIETDFEKLLLMPDSLMILENRALDTLRFLHDKLNQLNQNINSEIN